MADYVDKVKVGNATKDIQDSGARTNEGTLANLTTTEKTNLVGAINEVNGACSDLKSAINEFITTTYTEVTNRAILNTGEIAVRSAFGMAMLPCLPNTMYKITNPKGGYLSVGSSASNSYTQTLTHFQDYSTTTGCNYKTNNGEVYLFIVFWHNTSSYTLDEAKAALGISFLSAMDKVARGDISKIERFFDATDDASAEISSRAILGTGEIQVRTKFRMMRVECCPSTVYTIESPKGDYLCVGSSASNSYTQTLTNFHEYGQSAGKISFTTGANDLYLFVVFYYADYTSDSVDDCFAALTAVYYTAVDSSARAGVEKVKNEIANNNVAWVKGGVVSIIGDSISTYDKIGYKIDGYDMYYPTGDVLDVSDTWWEMISKYCGGSIGVNASCGESRVTNTKTGYPSFYDRVSLLGSPDTVFVELGTNDSTYAITLGDYDFESDVGDLSEATFRTAYIKGIKGIQANYPNAQIVLIILSMGDTYAESIIHIAQTMGLPYVLCRDYSVYQGAHPSKAGMWDIAAEITQRNKLIQKDIDSAVIYTNGAYHKLTFNNDGTVTWSDPLE